MSPQLEMLKGTLDLMVLQTLQAMGALHGYGIARRIEQGSRDAILLNEGTIYASLVRVQQRGSSIGSPTGRGGSLDRDPAIVSGHRSRASARRGPHPEGAHDSRCAVRGRGQGCPDSRNW